MELKVELRIKVDFKDFTEDGFDIILRKCLKNTIMTNLDPAYLKERFEETFLDILNVEYYEELSDVSKKFEISLPKLEEIKDTQQCVECCFFHKENINGIYSFRCLKEQPFIREDPEKDKNECLEFQKKK